MERTMKLYGDRVFGEKVSDYGLESGYLDYQTLAKIVGDCILNNTLRSETAEDWYIISGEFNSEVYQDYIISDRGYEVLSEYTDELVFYNEKLDIYVWGITHFGTAWSHVLTDIRLVR